MFVATACVDTFDGVTFVFSNRVLGRGIHLQCGQGKDQASHSEKGVFTVQLVISHTVGTANWRVSMTKKHEHTHAQQY